MLQSLFYSSSGAVIVTAKYAFIAATLSLAACQKVAIISDSNKNIQVENPISSKTSDMQSNIPLLDQTAWEIVSVNGIATEGVAPNKARIEFAKGNAVGSSGCNSFGGLYAQIGSKLYFGRSISTEMGCGGALGIQEKALYSLLTGITEAQVDKEGRILVTKGTQKVVLQRDKNCTSCASAVQPVVNLVGPAWKIQTINGKQPIGLNVFKNENDYMLKLTADVYQLRVGCNYVSGSYQKDGNRLVTQSGVSTLIGCPPGLAEQEQLVGLILSENPIIVHGFNMDMMLASKSGMLELQGPPDQRK